MTWQNFSQNRLRLDNFQKLLSKWRVDGFIIDDPIDVFYLTGMELSLGRLVVLKKDARLFVDGRYLQACQENCPVEVEAVSEKAVMAFAKGKIAIDSATTTLDQYAKLKKLKPVLISHPLRELRAIKDRYEIALINKSASLLLKGFMHIRKRLKAGITEKDLATEFEIYCRKIGADGLSFEPTIAFGVNTSMPHHRSGDTKLKKGDIVLTDIGLMVGGYASDMTRMLYFGSVDPRIIELEMVVRAAHRAALKLCRPGARVGALDEAARKVMRKAKLEDLFVHSLGHGVGLEIHEFPRIRVKGADKDARLKAGMVITIEPGLYLPGVGGVRHEDMILITKNGYSNFYV